MRSRITKRPNLDNLSAFLGPISLIVEIELPKFKDLPEEISTITLVYTLYPVQRIALNPLNNNNAAGDKI